MTAISSNIEISLYYTVKLNNERSKNKFIINHSYNSF